MFTKNRFLIPGTKLVGTVSSPAVVYDNGEVATIIDNLRRQITDWHRTLCAGPKVRSDVEIVDQRYLDIEGLLNDPRLFPYQDSNKGAVARLLPRLYHPRITAVLSDVVGLPLINLPFRDQIHLLNFAVNAKPDEWARFGAAIGRLDSATRLDFLRCFFGCTGDLAHAQNLLRITESVDPALSSKVFSKLARLYNQVDAIEQAIDMTNPGTLRAELLGQALQTLTSRTNELCKKLGATNDDVSQQGIRGINDLVERIMMIDEELIALGSLVKGKRKLGGSTTDGLDPRLNLARFSAANVTVRTRFELLDLARQNMESYPPAIKDIAWGELIGALGSEQSRFYVMKFRDEIISFVRFDSKPDGSVYLGSFNTREDATRLAFGMELLERALMMENQSSAVIAMVHGANPIKALYCQGLGFEATPVVVEGEQCFKLRLSKGALASRVNFGIAK